LLGARLGTQSGKREGRQRQDLPARHLNMGSSIAATAGG
jgi:hypothetical protein